MKVWIKDKEIKSVTALSWKNGPIATILLYPEIAQTMFDTNKWSFKVACGEVCEATLPFDKITDEEGNVVWQ